ncbi:TPA: hypothetical protein ACH3X3_003785 [Trebouxia sp. C0006]
MKGVREILLQRTSPGTEGLTYIAERRRRKGKNIFYKMEISHTILQPLPPPPPLPP